MITLIAESKTMKKELSFIQSTTSNNSRPIYEKEAKQIMSSLHSLQLSEICDRLKISGSLALKVKEYSNTFLDDQFGLQAIDAFTGEVFKALDVKAFNAKQRTFINGHVLIISSIYGLLRPSDIIRPYRFDYDIDLDCNCDIITKKYKSVLTIALINHIKEIGDKEILNLLPGAAMKYIDFKILKAFTKIEKPDFKIINENGELKTPSTGRLKELRGLLLRNIVENRIDNFHDLLKIITPDFLIDPSNSKPGFPLFLSTEKL